MRSVLAIIFMTGACVVAVAEDSKAAHLMWLHSGNKKSYEFSTSETHLLQTVFEKLCSAPDTSGKKIAAKPYGYVRVNDINYGIIDGTHFMIERTQQFVSPPEKVRAKLQSIALDDTTDVETRTALFVYVLKEWLQEESKKMQSRSSEK